MDTQENQKTKHIDGKKLAIIITASVLAVVIVACIAIFSTIWGVYGTAFLSSVNHKEAKELKFTKENAKLQENQVMFYGDSITEMYDLEEWYPNVTIYNRAISGDRLPHMVDRLKDNAIALKPKTFVFLGGANDLRDNVNPKDIADNIHTIISTMKKECPNTKIIVQSVYPCNYNKKFMFRNFCKNMTNENAQELNLYIQEMCIKENVIFVDTYSHLVDDNNQLKNELTIDGIHINDKAYNIVTNLLKEYII